MGRRGRRFQTNPDSVLSCEGAHSRWKWIESGKRNVKFKYLNALLKLQSWLRNNNGAFPDEGELVPYIVEARQQRLWRIEDLRAQGMPIYGHNGSAQTPTPPATPGRARPRLRVAPNLPAPPRGQIGRVVPWPAFFASPRLCRLY